MNEENKQVVPKEAKKPEDSGGDKGKEDKSTAEKLIQRSEELMQNNIKLQASLDEANLKLAEKAISGVTEAGQTQEKKETPKEYSERVMRGE